MCVCQGHERCLCPSTYPHVFCECSEGCVMSLAAEHASFNLVRAQSRPRIARIAPGGRARPLAWLYDSAHAWGLRPSCSQVSRKVRHALGCSVSSVLSHLLSPLAANCAIHAIRTAIRTRIEVPRHNVAKMAGQKAARLGPMQHGLKLGLGKRQ